MAEPVKARDIVLVVDDSPETLKLFQQRAAFGGLSVTLVAQPCDLELHLLDMERQRMGLRFGVGRSDPFDNDQCLQRLYIIGKRIDHLRHDAMESQNADVLEL